MGEIRAIAKLEEFYIILQEQPRLSINGRRTTPDYLVLNKKTGIITYLEVKTGGARLTQNQKMNAWKALKEGNPHLLAKFDKNDFFTIEEIGPSFFTKKKPR